MRVFFVLLLAAGPVWAEGWKMRSGDELFDVPGLQAALADQELVFYDEGRSVYGEDGYYSYTYGGGGLWEGTWRAEADSVVCVTFVTEVTRCDRIVRNGDRFVVLTENGERFPVKP